jgi:hypothetical protein
MGKSLTNLAKQIISESNDPTPDRDAKKMTPNAATLRPNSKGAEGRVVNPGSTPPVGGAQDLGSAPVAPGEGDNFGAKAASGQKKDTTVKGSTNPAEKSKQQAEYMEEEVEMTLDEAIEAYIAELAEQGLDEEAILEAVDAEFGEYLEEGEDDYQVDMSEHVEALFAGENLSEEFKEKAVTIFEAAVKQKVEEELANLEEAYAETLEEEVEGIRAELTENVDDYLNYVVENWVVENEVAIEAGLRTELTEEFITGLRQLFAEHYIDIPEDKVSVVEELAAKVSDLEEKLNEEFERNVALNKMLSESTQNDILADACDGLTNTQAEKLKALAEGINFTSVNEYSQKINILRESYFNGSVKSDNVLDNNEVDGDGRSMISEELKGPMAAYVRTLGKKLPN